MKALTSALILVAIAFVGWYFYSTYRVAPELELKSLKLSTLDGKPFNVSSLNGSRTIVCFSASWCGGCIQELNSLSMMKDRIPANTKVVVISDETPEVIEAFRDKHHYPFMFINLNTGFQDIGIKSIPTTFLQNEQGETVFREVGSIDYTDPATFNNIINKLTL